MAAVVFCTLRESVLITFRRKPMSITNLEDLFLHELKDVFDAEKQLLKALPKMAKAATSEELQTAFEEHAGVTEERSVAWNKCLSCWASLLAVRNALACKGSSKKARN